MTNLLKLMDLSAKEIIEILNTADQLKFEKKNRIPHRLLEGKVLGLIFEKSSTRTRVSFEVGMFDLGGMSLFLSSRDLQIGRGEAVQDTARVLSRYLDGIMIRTFAQEEVEALARFGTIPIINGLTDYCHPCQVLADLMTIREIKGSFEGRKLCYVGDGNNMTNSLIVGGIKLGMDVSVACPKGYEPDAAIMKWAAENGNFLYRGRAQGCRGFRRALHRRLGVYGTGRRSRGAQENLQVLSDKRRNYESGEIGRNRVALSARAPRRGNHFLRIRKTLRGNLRGSGKQASRPESRPCEVPARLNSRVYVEKKKKAVSSALCSGTALPSLSVVRR